MKATDTGVAAADWRSVLRARVPLFGHRNWIVVADAAYPAQSSPGIETVVAGAGMVEVLREVVAALAAAPHVRPILHADSELAFVSESDAPGVAEFRTKLGEVLQGCAVDVIPHEQILARLDAAGGMFQVLIIKTELTIPYTSVFVELDCGYWSAEAEGRLRKVIGGR